jgi:murein DD-endopeptidase MepM/ murein hydrolase activator NlpD
MQIMITHDGMARTRNWSLSRFQLAAAAAALVVVLLMLSGAIYHFIFLKAAQEGWPVVSQLVKLVVRDEFAQRDRFMRENLDAMATKVGDLQAKMIRMDAQAERLGRLAGVKPEDLRVLQGPTGGSSAPVAPAASGPLAGGKGGPFVPLDHPTLRQLNDALSDLDQQVDLRSDVFTLAESRLFESRLTALMVPNSRPIDGPVGSGYGFRSDPFTGRAALHTGLDFPADVGTPIRAAAGGVVVSTDVHPEYGNLLVIDHGNGLVTRYAHTSKILVKVGDLVRRDQVVALVGTTGRSTGPHLHFEVLVDGVTQNPARFLAAGPAPTLTTATAPVAAR